VPVRLVGRSCKCVAAFRGLADAICARWLVDGMRADWRWYGGGSAAVAVKL